MHRSLPKRRRVTATFILMLLVTTLIASLLPKATATPTEITSIDPESGYVGDIVRLVGEIDTQNGTYTIFFDEEEKKSGTAVGTAVNDTFVVPPRPMGNYTVKLCDVAANTNGTKVFEVQTAYYIKAVAPSPPKQLQEGDVTKILVNVTGGEANTVYSANITVKEPPPANSTFWAPVSLTNTTTTGSGNGSTVYPGPDFGGGSHTNYTGTYNIAFNETQTLASGSFTVGLTNATEYHRFQVVSIRAAGYTQANESVWLNITFAGESVNGFPKNVSAVGGVVEAIWTIPSNASMGLYTVNIATSITNGTVKPVPNNQTFTIVRIPFQVRTVKLDGEVLEGVKVEVYDATNELVAANTTGKDGLAGLSVEGGNYSFNAFWNIKPFPDILYVVVGTLLNQTIKRNVTLTLLCWIAYVRVEIDPPLPFIDITLTYHGITNSFETDIAGVWNISRNMATNISYTIEARRYGFLFNTTHMEKLPAKMNASWVNITITCPTYTMFVHAVDSKGLPLQNVEVSVYEWSSGVTKPEKSETTNEWGSVTFLNLTFGKYKVWVYDPNSTIILNKTVVNLIEDQLFLVIHCKIFNIDLSVVVKDYFGNPIPNVLVKVERENLDISPKKTDSKGTASFSNIVGGECQISVSVTEKLSETRTMYLDETKVAMFKLDKYVAVGGHVMETAQLITWISLGALITVFALALAYRKFYPRRVQKEEKEKSL